MPAIIVPIDDSTHRRLESLGLNEGIEVPIIASRILRRALRSARPRRHFDPIEIARLNEEFEEEDLALAESDAQVRLKSLIDEDSH